MLDDMRIGQDISRRIDDDAGTHSLLFCEIGRLPRVWILYRGQAGDLDSHHRRPNAFGQRLQIFIELEQAVPHWTRGGLLHRSGNLCGCKHRT